MFADERLTDWACWRPKACVQIIAPRPSQHSSLWQIVTEKDRFIPSASERVLVATCSDGKETNSIHSCHCLCCYVDYFVQNVYWACAYIEINFTTNMIQCNFDVNVLSSDFSRLMFFLNYYFFILFCFYQPWTLIMKGAAQPTHTHTQCCFQAAYQTCVLNNCHVFTKPTWWKRHQIGSDDTDNYLIFCSTYSLNEVLSAVQLFT